MNAEAILEELLGDLGKLTDLPYRHICMAGFPEGECGGCLLETLVTRVGNARHKLDQVRLGVVAA